MFLPVCWQSYHPLSWGNKTFKKTKFPGTPKVYCVALPVDAVGDVVAVRFPRGVVVGEMIVELMRVAVVHGGVGVDAVAEGVLGTVGRWVLYGCGQGRGVSINPCSVPGFGVLMFCGAWEGAGPIPMTILVDQEFWRLWSD